MGALFDKIAEWLEGILVDASMDNLKSLFDSVNEQVSKVAGQVGTSPAGFSPSIFSMIRNISETVIMPIAGIILTFIACYELIQLVTEHNNLANLDLWIIFKWIFKTFAAVLIITNTFNIVMAVFDVAQHVIGQSGSLISGSTQITAMDMDVVKETLEDMELGGLLAVFLETFILKLMLKIMSAIIFVIIYGRMIEIYLMTSLAPIPMATLANREQSQVGQNYLRSLFALGFQGFLILICVGIYAVLIQNFALSDNLMAGVWSVAGYTILLCFTLFKTGSLAKSVFNAH
ncbi:MAG: hypothetical protein IJ252_00770 [Solobacterium sp.]|nr:hypothetical protein [Solobacterium sp.]